ncbi:hypothetical protein GMRT_15645 [Giardia muris]|uniref:Uncharacterized protein n=1 Tax=Giardia muris TaxID=5742 RepID=A0A4Z1SSA7_GIAMU|nr:hypothetical protein GMRT_15645 [Giardia muris]|eukprot:TNJ28764.1 hypothetical protein GMRT_15645 [Giardia muris]
MLFLSLSRLSLPGVSVIIETETIAECPRLKAVAAEFYLKGFSSPPLTEGLVGRTAVFLDEDGGSHALRRLALRILDLAESLSTRPGLSQKVSTEPLHTTVVGLTHTPVDINDSQMVCRALRKTSPLLSTLEQRLRARIELRMILEHLNRLLFDVAATLVRYTEMLHLDELPYSMLLEEEITKTKEAVTEAERHCAGTANGHTAVVELWHAFHALCLDVGTDEGVRTQVEGPKIQNE